MASIGEGFTARIKKNESRQEQTSAAFGELNIDDTGYISRKKHEEPTEDTYNVRHRRPQMSQKK